MIIGSGIEDTKMNLKKLLKSEPIEVREEKKGPCFCYLCSEPKDGYVWAIIKRENGVLETYKICDDCLIGNPKKAV